jgi:hypothetical protein
VNPAFLFAAVLGCGLSALKPVDAALTGDTSTTDRGGPADADADADADGDADADADGDSDITYPNEDMNSILLYFGHGGADGSDPYGWGSFETVIPIHWADQFGWNTHWREDLPDSSGIAFYRMIGLMAPGSRGEIEFDANDVYVLQAALDQGTRVVLFTDRGACGSTATKSLMGELGVSMRPSTDGEGTRSIVEDAEIVAGHQVTRGVSSLSMRDPCFIDTWDATVLASRVRDDQTRVYIASERPGSAGDVVIVGDFEMFDDSDHLGLSENRRLIDNLATVGP